VPPSVDPALQGLLPGVPLGAVGRNRLELPFKALEGREIGSCLGGHLAYCAARRASCVTFEKLVKEGGEMGAYTLGLLIGYAIYGIIFGAICRWLAIQKNRSGSNWFIVGFFFGLIGLLMIGFSPALSGSQKKQRDSSRKGRATSLSLVQQAKILYETDRLKFISVTAVLAAFTLWAVPLDIVWLDGLHFDGLLAGGCGFMEDRPCFGELGAFTLRSIYIFDESWTLEVYAAAMFVIVSVITFVLRLSNRQKS
jgi:hypothetical protein